MKRLTVWMTLDGFIRNLTAWRPSGARGLEPVSSSCTKRPRATDDMLIGELITWDYKKFKNVINKLFWSFHLSFKTYSSIWCVVLEQGLGAAEGRSMGLLRTMSVVLNAKNVGVSGHWGWIREGDGIVVVAWKLPGGLLTQWSGNQLTETGRSG